jgi:hypothetical protein
MLIAAGDRTVPCTVQTRTTLSPTEAHRIIVPIDLSLVFTGWGPFPGVRGANNQTGAWDAVGQSRNPDLTDNSTAFEVLTELNAGYSFAYETTEFTNLLGKVIEGVRGEWTFTPDGEGAVIRWTYEFKPLPRRHLLLKCVIVPLWRNYMQTGVVNSARAAETFATIG